LKLSMMGHNQSEIEGILTGITEQQLQRLKNRLRRDVLETLMQHNLHNEIELSRTEQDLGMIRDIIRTEIRFAGLENDRLLLRMIRHKFGIALQNI
jgi:serine protease inhibitor